MALTAYQTDYGEAVGDSNLINQVQAAFQKAAQNIYSEGTGVTNHAQRAALANKIANGPIPQQYILAAVVSGGLNATSPDASVDTVVASIWALLANA